MNPDDKRLLALLPCGLAGEPRDKIRRAVQLGYDIYKKCTEKDGGLHVYHRKNETLIEILFTICVEFPERYMAFSSPEMIWHFGRPICGVYHKQTIGYSLDALKFVYELSGNKLVFAEKDERLIVLGFVCFFKGKSDTLADDAFFISNVEITTFMIDHGMLDYSTFFFKELKRCVHELEYEWSEMPCEDPLRTNDDIKTECLCEVCVCATHYENMIILFENVKPKKTTLSGLLLNALNLEKYDYRRRKRPIEEISQTCDKPKQPTMTPSSSLTSSPG